MSQDSPASRIAFGELLPLLAAELGHGRPMLPPPLVVFELNASKRILLVHVGPPGKRVTLRFDRKDLSRGNWVPEYWYCGSHTFGSHQFDRCCDHVADAIHHLVSLVPSNNRAGRAPSGGKDEATIPAEVQSWLTTLSRQGGEAARNPPAPPGLDRADHLVFFAGAVEVPGYPFPCIVVESAYTSITAQDVPLFEVSPRDLEQGTAVTARLTPEEVDCLVAMKGCQRAADLPSSLVVRSAVATRFFRSMLIRGRVAIDSAKHGFRMARQAPDTTIPLSWKFGDDAKMRLALGLADGQSIQLTDYPFLVDDEACTFSRITGLDTKTLVTLATAPPVPLAHIPAMIVALERANLSVVPPVPETVPRTSRRVPMELGLGVVLGVETDYADAVRLIATPWATYGPHRVPILYSTFGNETAEDLWRHVGNEIIVTPRNPGAEREIFKHLVAAGFTGVGYPDSRGSETVVAGASFRRAQLAAKVAAMIASLSRAGIVVELDERLGIQLIRNDAASSYGELRDGTRGTIELDAGIEFDGRRVPIANLLRAAIVHPAWQSDGPIEPAERVLVPIDDTAVANLPLHRVRDVLAPYLDFFAILGPPEPGHLLRLPRPMLLATAANNAHRAVFEKFGSMAGFVAAAAKVARYADNPVPVSPPGVHATLRAYQQTGVAWIEALTAIGSGGVLADDMGLGKTLQCLTAICIDRGRTPTAPPVLVVAPAAVVSNWIREALQFTPALVMLDLTGPGRHARYDLIDRADVVVSNYNLLRIDIEHLERHQFSLAIFDEAQYLKTYTGATHRCARRVRYQRALCVTGTPIDNHLGELQAIFAIAVPGLFDDPKHFTRRFRRPIEDERCQATSSLLTRVIAPFMLRRTKREVASDLPPKSTVLRFVELGATQRSLYNKAAAEANRAVWDVLDELGINRTQVQLMARLTQLRQIACHPPLCSDQRVSGCKESAKVDEMVRHLAELAAQGRRVMVVSEWVTLLDVVAQRLAVRDIAFLRYTGDESAKQKDDVTRRFQLGTTPVLLLSLKAGGVGITLTAADTVMLASLWWAPGAEGQAVDRTHRIGQTMPVTIFKYIVRGTVEEKILEIQSFKRELADAILSGDFSNSMASLSEQDIVDLFGARNSPHSLPDSDVIEGEFEEIPEPPRLPTPFDEAAFDRRAAAALVKDWVRAVAVAHGIGLSDLARRIGRKPVWFLNRVSGASLLPPSVLVAVADALDTPLPDHVLGASRAVYGHDPDLDASP